MALTLDQINSCTVPWYGDSFVNQVYDSQPILKKIRDGGRVKKHAEGGTYLRLPIRWKELGTGSFLDPDSARNTIHVETRTAGQWSKKYEIVDTVLTWEERAANKSEPMMVSLMADKAVEAAEELAEVFTDTLYKAYASIGSNDIEGFFAIIRDPSTATTYAGISSGDAASWVAGVYYTSAVSLALYGSYSLDYGMRQCRFGASGYPDLIITTPTLVSVYSSKLQPSERRQPENGKSGTVTDLYFQGAPIISDPHCTASNVIFTNTKNLWLLVDGEWDFSFGPWESDPDRYHASRALATFVGNFATDLRKAHGAYTSVT